MTTLSNVKSHFINDTLSYDTFSIIETNTDGSCCYNSVYKLLIINNIIDDNLTTFDLQKKCVEWIRNNRQLYLSKFDMTIQEYVLFNHSLNTLDEYIKYYNIDSSGYNDDIPIQIWGGIPELIALSYLYNVNINIYTGKTYLKNKNKIIKGAIINNKPRKDFRFQLLMCTTRYEFNNTFNILYYENKYTKHFYALNKNDID
tara:strand:+ start:834 stop:1436 length:603 start_codon:yes stop_codon:yes gene_type:complete